MLPQAPERLTGGDGKPAFGLYLGEIDDARFGHLVPPPTLLERHSIEKRWQYFFVPTDEVMLAMAIVDAGYLGSGFCAIFDRGSGRLLVDSNPVVPPLLATVAEAPFDASMIGPMVRAKFERKERRVHVHAAWATAVVELEVDLARAPSPVTAIAGVGQDGRFDLTQKTVLAPAQGEIRAGNSTFAVRGELGGFDYTHGLLSRETAWRWAFGMRDGIGFSLSEGFLQGQGENVVWVEGEPRAAGPVKFTHGAPEEPWRVEGENVALTFTPEGHRAQNIDLRLIKSAYVQPFGTFAGTLFGTEIEDVPGVAEDHVARW